VADVRPLKSTSGPSARPQGGQRRATESQAVEATLKLISQWTQPKTNEYADQVTEVFLNYSAEVIFRCADPMRGIGATRPNEMPRRHPPSVGEIKYFCDHTVLDDSRPKPLISPAPARPEASAEDKARAAATSREIIARLSRASKKGAKKAPLSSNSFSNELPHQHQHHHHQPGDGDGGGGGAATLTNQLLRIAEVRLAAEPAFARQELGLVKKWFSWGLDADTILHVAKLQMARKLSGRGMRQGGKPHGFVISGESVIVSPPMATVASRGRALQGSSAAHHHHSKRLTDQQRGRFRPATVPRNLQRVLTSQGY
jgi:hypothetical protein